MLTFLVILMVNLLFSTVADKNAELEKKYIDNSLIVDSREDCEPDIPCVGLACLGSGIGSRPCKPKPTKPTGQKDCEPDFNCALGALSCLGSALSSVPCKPKPTKAPHCENRHGVVYCKPTGQKQCVGANKFCPVGTTCCGNLKCEKSIFGNRICKATNGK